ncbi:MAG: DUF3307 domain-containing protein [Anaerolineaceae bacterium]|jgi:hypothetical protein
MINPLILYLLAHTLGDYYLQNDALSGKKRSHYYWVLLHSLVYALPFALLGFVLQGAWLKLALMAAAHALIDTIKYAFEKRSKLPEHVLFVLDTAAHLLSIYLLHELLPTVTAQAWLMQLPADVWRWLLLIALIWRPANVSFKKLFRRYTYVNKLITLETKPEPRSKPAKGEEKHETVAGAGAAIGIMERLFTVIFAAFGQFSAFGFLMAAKSIARYDRITKDSAFSEYYLIGTLYSILYALAAWLIIFKLL